VRLSFCPFGQKYKGEKVQTIDAPPTGSKLSTELPSSVFFVCLPAKQIKRFVLGLGACVVGAVNREGRWVAKAPRPFPFLALAKSMLVAGKCPRL
jgi:hypothetical protein